jgi:MFS family permease
VAQAVGGGANESSWMLASLTLAFVVFAPPVSQAADYWGRRWPLIILALLGCVGTIITSRASSMGMAITGEVFVGVSFAATVR